MPLTWTHQWHQRNRSAAIPRVKTPHFNRLAHPGTTFLNAHCQSPICNPSRASVLTGLRPSTTGIYGLLPIFRASPVGRGVVTFPQAFQRGGYHTYAAGRIFHDNAMSPAERTAEFPERATLPGCSMPKQRFSKVPPLDDVGTDWGTLSRTRAIDASGRGAAAQRTGGAGGIAGGGVGAGEGDAAAGEALKVRRGDGGGGIEERDPFVEVVGTSAAGGRGLQLGRFARPRALHPQNRALTVMVPV